MKSKTDVIHLVVSLVVTFSLSTVFYSLELSSHNARPDATILLALPASYASSRHLQRRLICQARGCGAEFVAVFAKFRFVRLCSCWFWHKEPRPITGLFPVYIAHLERVLEWKNLLHRKKRVARSNAEIPAPYALPSGCVTPRHPRAVHEATHFSRVWTWPSEFWHFWRLGLRLEQDRRWVISSRASEVTAFQVQSELRTYVYTLGCSCQSKGGFSVAECQPKGCFVLAIRHKEWTSTLE